jgi:hypothetical protein
VALANFLKPAQTREVQPNGAYFTQRYFPLLALVSWVGGTAAHFYCIDYVNVLRWSPALLVPALWVAAWTVWKFSLAMDFSLRRDISRGLFSLPVAVLALAAYYKQWGIVFALTMLNAPIYFALAAQQRDRLAMRLCLLSVSLMGGAVPQSWLLSLHFPFTRPELLGMSALGFVLISTALSRNPKAAVLGSIAATLFVASLPPGIDVLMNPALQTGAIFFLVHSLRWSEGIGAPLRIIAAVFWMTHSLIWVGTDSDVARNGVLVAAASVVAVYFLARFVLGAWGPRIIPFTAMAVSFGPLLCHLARLLKEAPAGLLVLLGSFALFALGTVAALTKSRWLPQEQIVSDVVEGKETI